MLDMKMGILFMLLALALIQPTLIFATVDRKTLEAIKNQTSYTLEEIRNICQGWYPNDVPSLNCGAINLCLNYGLSIPECYDDLFLPP